MVLHRGASLVVFASFCVFCDVSAESFVDVRSAWSDFVVRPPFNFLGERTKNAALAPVPVFSNGAGGITCFRIPAAVRTTKGTVLAFAEGRHGSCGDGAVQDIVVRRSTDHGAKWSKLSVAVGNASHVVGNPYPIALSSSRVALVYVKHGQDKNPHVGLGNGIVWSDDDGLTWSDEQDVSKMFGTARGALPGPGAGVELASGRLLVISHKHKGAYTDGKDRDTDKNKDKGKDKDKEKGKDKDEDTDNDKGKDKDKDEDKDQDRDGGNDKDKKVDFVTYSDDGGKTWTTFDHSFPEMDEGTLADLGGGHVLANMRNAHEPTKGRAIARSYDGGLTWSNITYDAALVGPICEGSLATIGNHVYFSGPANRTSRSDLTIRRSDDGGSTWAASLLITAETTQGYSSLIQGPVGDDAHGGILYESPGGGIDFLRFPL